MTDQTRPRPQPPQPGGRSGLRRPSPAGPGQARPATAGPPPARTDAAGAGRLTRRMRGWWSASRAHLGRLSDRTEPYRAAARPVLDAAGGVLAAVTGFGWTTLGLVALAWLSAALWGWREAALLAAALLVAFGIACLFTIGRVHLSVELDTDPLRVTVGESSAARVRVTNLARTPALPIGLEFPVGDALGRFTLPGLGGGATHEEVVIIPTQRRGVIELGPVVTQRGDPFGLVRREVTWTERLELFVHPRRVPLEPLGAGLLRDLEGHTTTDTSMSDLAFHTLREYAPGDDRRYIHWRSSAKVSAASGQGSFLVKQFLDTRRSHVAVVVDADEAAYASDAEFELAVSVGASVVVRALADEMDLTIVVGEHAAAKPHPALALDTFSRAGFGPGGLAGSTGRLVQLAPDASVAILVSGSRAGFADFAHARAHLAPEVHTFAVTVDRGATMALRQASGMAMLTVSTLSDLPRVLPGVQVQ